MKGQNQVTGKRGELIVIGKILESGITVYTPVCDVEGIDCIARNDKNRLIEIQIKTRNKNGEYQKNFMVTDFQPHKDFFICCYFLDTDELWTLPSYKFLEDSVLNKEGKRVLAMTPNKERNLTKYFNKYGLNLLHLKPLED